MSSSSLQFFNREPPYGQCHPHNIVLRLSFFNVTSTELTFVRK